MLLLEFLRQIKQRQDPLLFLVGARTLNGKKKQKKKQWNERGSSQKPEVTAIFENMLTECFEKFLFIFPEWSSLQLCYFAFTAMMCYAEYVLCFKTALNSMALDTNLKSSTRVGTPAKRWTDRERRAQKPGCWRRGSGWGSAHGYRGFAGTPGACWSKLALKHS